MTADRGTPFSRCSHNASVFALIFASSVSFRSSSVALLVPIPLTSVALPASTGATAAVRAAAAAEAAEGLSLLFLALVLEAAGGDLLAPARRPALEGDKLRRPRDVDTGLLTLATEDTPSLLRIGAQSR